MDIKLVQFFVCHVLDCHFVKLREYFMCTWPPFDFLLIDIENTMDLHLTRKVFV